MTVSPPRPVRVTEKEMVPSAATFASLIFTGVGAGGAGAGVVASAGGGPPRRPLGDASVPVKVVPSYFNTRVLVASGPPPLPGWVHVQVPVRSLALTAARARLTAPSVTAVQASTFNKDFDVNFILFLGLRLVVCFQAPAENTLRVYAPRDLLGIKTVLPTGRLQVYFVARFSGEERIGWWDYLARLPRSKDLNEEPRKALKHKHLYEKVRDIEVSEENSRRGGLPRPRLALLERRECGAGPNCAGQPFARLDGCG